MDAISTKSQSHIGSIEDYATGWAAGKIEGMFGGYFAYTFGTGQYTQKSMLKLPWLCLNDLQIRNAIFGAGEETKNS
jgi:hypothetical protein